MCEGRRPPSPASPRNGVTLLEVIVAMFVLVVGLLGLAALIPLGRLEMAEGDRLDNSSTLGRSAFRELTVRGYLNPQLWVHPVSGRPVADSSRYFFEGDKGPALVPPYAPLIIDPLMCAPRFQQEAVNAKTLTDAENKHRRAVQYFPYGAVLPGSKSGWPETDMPKFARATLRTYPIDASVSLASSAAHTMRFDLASRYFRSSDDIVVDLPLDRARRPVQVFFQSEMTNYTVTATDGVVSEIPQQQAAFRKFRGDYSWFFVVEPSQAERASPDAQMPSASGSSASPYSAHSFRVSVVICNKRDLRDASGLDLDDDRAVGERCVWLDFVDRYTARLRILDVADEGTALKILDVRPNQWIAAASCFPNPLLGEKEYVLEWLRIVNVADRPTKIDDTSTWYREITFTGRDVSTPGTSTLGVPLQDASEFNYPDLGLNPQTAWGVVIPGVRGVYEKTIYMDRPSLWAPQ